MSTSIAETIVKHGRETAHFFREDGRPGDWSSWPVAFPQPFPSDDVRVVAMAAHFQVDEGLGTVPAVPTISGISASGFTINARNSDCASGSAGMHWIAVQETPGQRSPEPVDVRTAVLQGRWAAPDCVVGDWVSWNYPFGIPLKSTPTVVGTGRRSLADNRTELIGGALFTDIPVLVGVVANAHVQGVDLNARNGGGWPGLGGMNFAAVSPGVAGSGVIVDSGVTEVIPGLPPAGGTVSRSLDVHFTLPFQTPPVVLVTACDRGLPAGETCAAIVGTAQDVTTHGFTLQAMNTDSAPGRCAFSWVAIGCGIHCAAGRG